MLQGILSVLHTGIQWEFLPQELGFGSGMTCWRRLRERRPGSKHHVLTDDGGIPLAAILTDGNRHDVTVGTAAGRGAERARPTRSSPTTHEDRLR